eukprot:CAMPEP_0116548322 /NCGR_PEP_ID=MMETSP0397-20121206/4264_1 /TAXON_ID=216820 /ORGANISM="Cyclophora tenuis, Strain ECT3854" /LENGTH=123 /DNA_ID=CAMNT_0004072943 /DNA_START=21 /DNA_END=392 /DNA_ORIENTATION=-
MVRVHDGMDNGCLHSLEHQIYGNEVLSLHHGCYMVNATIAVSTPSDSGLTDDGTGLHVPELVGIPLPAIIFWALVGAVLLALLLCFARCCSMFCSCSCCKTKNKTHKKKKPQNQQAETMYLDV